MATKNNVQNGISWAQELSAKYAAGISQVFVIHFNVDDYAKGLVPIKEYLLAMLEARDLVISYDIAHGIRFEGKNGKAQQALFVKALGLETQDDLAAQMGLSGGSNDGGEVELPTQPHQALPLLERALHLESIQMDDGSTVYPKVAVIINWADQVAPALMAPADRQAMVRLAGWATDPQIIANHGIVILITRNLTDLAEPLRAATSRIEPCAIPLPNEEQRLDWIRYYLDVKERERAESLEAQAWEGVRGSFATRAGEDWIWPNGGLWDNTLDSAPNPKARQEAERLFKKARRKLGQAMPKLKLAMPVEQLARATAGLALVHIEDIMLRAQHERRDVDAELVRDRKEAIIAQEFGDVLEVMEPGFGLDMIAGHEPVKAYFQEYVIEALRRGDVARAPQSVLLMGPPGTGKTALVEAVAHDSGFNCVVLNLAKILAGLVGASERNLEKALLAIEALTPCVVFIDEIDQKMQRSEGFQGDSGVGARLFGRVMEFMSDTTHRGRIVFLLATNRPDLLDPALKRPGRMDEKIPMLLPTTPDERLEIVDVMLRKYNLRLDTDDTRTSTEVKLDEVATLTADWSGAGIEAVVIKAHQIAGREGRKPGVIHPDDLLTAIKKTIPSRTGAAFMTALALAETTDMDFIPEAYREQATNREQLDEEIRSRQPVHGRRGAREL